MINKIKDVLGQDKNIKIIKWFLGTLVVLIFLLAIVLTANASINTKYRDVYLPGTKLAGIDISNLSFAQAKVKVQARIDELNRQGFVYLLNDKKIVILPSVSSASADISYPIVIWEGENSLQAIKNWQANNSLGNLINKVYVWTKGKNWPLAYTWDQEQHLQILQDNVAEFLVDKQEASFTFGETGLEISPEKVGQTFNYQVALGDTLERIKYLDNQAITLKIISDQPQITAAIIKQYQPNILATATRGDLHFTWEDKDWAVPYATWRSWLRLVIADKKIQLVFEQTEVQKYLSESGINEIVEIPLQDAKFKLNNGKVSEFMSSQQGRAIRQADLLNNLNQVLNNNKIEFKVILTTDIVEPKVMNSDVNDLGIKQIIGTGSSDFKGSPANRVHNIKTGAEALNGLLIRPDEDFSLITALGEIDGEHGYKQELVIKGNKTTPEYGGGLCQIGTTVFRAALGTGLPITERRNHSYRVVYYEPAGMDATIYSPKPDLKFINDTGHYILIQSRIEGTKLYFDFWGTPDGRVASTTQPLIYNQVAPAPKKMVKTIDLPVGQTKCTESAHAGADAKFDYIVQYLNKPEPIKVTFSSHYIPWQAVCLVGATQEEIDAEANGIVLPGSTTTPTTTIPN